MRLLVVEDEATIARELQLRWRPRGWLVECCATLASASEVLRLAPERGGFDLVVLDLGLPDGDGVTWLENLRARDRITPVIVLTSRDRVADRVRGLDAGADDYLVKPFAGEELDARIAALQRRGLTASGELLHYGHLTWMGSEGRAYVDGRPLELLPREFEMLGLLLRRAPRLVRKRVLIAALAERNEDVGDSAAELYVSRLRRKLAGSGTTIRTMRGFGYLLTHADDDSEAHT
jgi:DNA-binding response OmpR family regulator